MILYRKTQTRPCYRFCFILFVFFALFLSFYGCDDSKNDKVIDSDSCVNESYACQADQLRQCVNGQWTDISPLCDGNKATHCSGDQLSEEMCTTQQVCRLGRCEEGSSKPCEENELKCVSGQLKQCGSEAFVDVEAMCDGDKAVRCQGDELLQETCTAKQQCQKGRCEDKEVGPCDLTCSSGEVCSLLEGTAKCLKTCQKAAQGDGYCVGSGSTWQLCLRDEKAQWVISEQKNYCTAEGTWQFCSKDGDFRADHCPMHGAKCTVELGCKYPDCPSNVESAKCDQNIAVVCEHIEDTGQYRLRRTNCDMEKKTEHSSHKCVAYSVDGEDFATCILTCDDADATTAFGRCSSDNSSVYYCTEEGTLQENKCPNRCYTDDSTGLMIAQCE